MHDEKSAFNANRAQFLRAVIADPIAARQSESWFVTCSLSHRS
jgi:hypothetical protein